MKTLMILIGVILFLWSLVIALRVRKRYAKKMGAPAVEGDSVSKNYADYLSAEEKKMSQKEWMRTHINGEWPDGVPVGGLSGPAKKALDAYEEYVITIRPDQTLKHVKVNLIIPPQATLDESGLDTKSDDHL